MSVTTIKDAGIKLGKRVVYTIDLDNPALSNEQKVELASYCNEYVNTTLRNRVVIPPVPSPTTSNILFAANFLKPYNLTDGQKSPDGEWFCPYAGHGSAIVNNNSITIQPQKATGDNTSACQVRSTKEFGDSIMSFTIKTIKQLKDSPQPWEVGWFMWHYNDDIVPLTGKPDAHHHYTMYVRPLGGVEIARKDYDLYNGGLINSLGQKIPGDQEQQQFVFTPPKGEGIKWVMGQEYRVKIKHVGNNITVWVNDQLQCDIVDNGKRGMDGATDTRPAPPPSPKIAKGHVAFYCEDSVAVYKDLVITKP